MKMLFVVFPFLLWGMSVLAQSADELMGDSVSKWEKEYLQTHNICTDVDTFFSVNFSRMDSMLQYVPDGLSAALSSYYNRDEANELCDFFLILMFLTDNFPESRSWFQVYPSIQMISRKQLQEIRQWYNRHCNNITCWDVGRAYMQGKCIMPPHASADFFFAMSERNVGIPNPAQADSCKIADNQIQEMANNRMSAVDSLQCQSANPVKRYIYCTDVDSLFAGNIEKLDWLISASASDSIVLQGWGGRDGWAYDFIRIFHLLSGTSPHTIGYGRVCIVANKALLRIMKRWFQKNKNRLTCRDVNAAYLTYYPPVRERN